MATLKISELRPGHIYRETLSGMRVRFRYAFGDGSRGSAIYFCQPIGRFVAFDVRDGELMEEPVNDPIGEMQD